MKYAALLIAAMIIASFISSAERGFSSNKLQNGELLGERISLFLTFHSYDKVQKAFSYMNERLGEAIYETEKSRFEDAEEIIGHSTYYSNTIRDALQNFAGEPEEETDKILQIENQLENYKLNSFGFMLALDKAMLDSAGTANSEAVHQMLDSEAEKLQAAVSLRKSKTVIKLKAVHQFDSKEAEAYLQKRMKELGIAKENENRMRELLAISEDYIGAAIEKIEHAHDRGYNTDNLVGLLSLLREDVRNSKILAGQEKATTISQIAIISQQTSSIIIAESNESMFEHQYLSKAEHAVAEARHLRNASASNSK